MVIKRNGKDENGKFGLSLHDGSGGVPKVQRMNSEAELRACLLKYGVTDAYSEDILSRLKRKHQSVEITVRSALVAGVVSQIPSVPWQFGQSNFTLEPSMEISATALRSRHAVCQSV